MRVPIIALDFPDQTTTMNFLNQISNTEKLYLKIGMELFYKEGLGLISELKSRDHAIFLDLKLHDIPNTVKSAMIGLASSGVDMLNVHAAGGQRMMEDAMEGLIIGSGSSARPKLIAVTQLTSITESEMQHDQGLTMSLRDSVLHYSRLTQAASLDGVVCSAHEVQAIKSVTNNQFLCVTPGIRLESDACDDQRRVVTPTEAKIIGSDYIVVGRSITRSQNPEKTYQLIKQQWQQEK